jgi:hypothetical protein
MQATLVSSTRSPRALAAASIDYSAIRNCRKFSGVSSAAGQPQQENNLWHGLCVNALSVLEKMARTMKNLLLAAMLVLGFGIFMILESPPQYSGFVGGVHATLAKLSQDLPPNDGSPTVRRAISAFPPSELADLVCMVKRCEMDSFCSEQPARIEPDCGGWDD